MVSSTLDRPHEALAANERAEAILDANGMERSVQMAMLLNNRAAIQRALGDLRLALSSSERAARMRTALLGPHHPDVLMSVANLAAQHLELGELERAEREAQRALSLANGIGPAADPMRASALNTLANIAFARGEHAEARSAYRRLLKLPMPDDDRARIWMNLANAHEAAGDPGATASALLRAETLLEKTLGPEHPRARPGTARASACPRARGRP